VVSLTADVQHFLQLVLLSFPTGFLMGLTGIGGAAVMTPLLILVLRSKPHLAVGTDLVFATLTKVLGAAVHWRLKHVDLKMVRSLSVGSVPGGVGGTLAGIELGRNSDDSILRISIGFVVLLVAAVVLFQQAFPKLGRDVSPWIEKRRTAVTIAYGAVIGFAVGLTSVGSGSLILPFLLIVHRLSVGKAVGTDVFHGAVLMGVSASFHATLGNVQWDLIPGLLAGSIPGVTLGSFLAPRLPEAFLKTVLVGVLIVTAYKLLV
jgi:uncharacterized membrane protein YfcA